jgi:predicted glycosyltransferase
MASEDRGARRPRVALYSHDTMGLGHMRRNLLIAHSLMRAPLQPVVLMIAGAREAGGFAFPPGVDCVTLPALRKDAPGQYGSRHLDISLQDLRALRANILRAVLEEFEPDVLLVDNVPRGAVRELDPALAALRTRGRTRCVLGLRDVLDEPQVVRWEWHRAANEDALREYYDAVWVYGDPNVYRLDHAYQFSPDLAAKIRYTGYLDQTARTEPDPCMNQDSSHASELPPGRLVLCLVGGGQDGARLAEAFAQADLPDGTIGVILTGPFMPADTRQRLMRSASGCSRLHVLQFVNEPGFLLRRAERVIGMGGYNTVTEVLSYDKHALIVPRVQPRLEQLIRAERLRDLGILDMLHPDELDPLALSTWLQREPGEKVSSRGRVDLNGLRRLPCYLNELLGHALGQSTSSTCDALASAS